MYERFTDRARKVMQLANQEAQRFNHEYIGTEHILLGLVKEGTGVAANVLKNLNIDLGKVRLEVEKIAQAGPEKVSMGKLPQTPRAEKVIEYSIEEARNLNHDYVGTEHLLLGLLREQEGAAAQVLMNLGIKLEPIRNEVLNLLGSERKGRSPVLVKWLIGATFVVVGILILLDVFQHEIEIWVALFSIVVGFLILAVALLESDFDTHSRFTDRACKVMQLACKEAFRLNHEYLGTEHILLGLVKENPGVAADVLKNLDIDLRKIRLEVEKIVCPGPDKVTMGKLPQTPRAKKVIEYSVDEARNLNHNYVGTEHLLLGLLREKEGPAAQVFMNLGLKLEDVREEVLKLSRNNKTTGHDQGDSGTDQEEKK